MKTLFVTVGVCILIASFFLYSSEPEASIDLGTWRQGGEYFNFKGFAVFYKDLISTSASTDHVLVILHGFPSLGYDWIKVLPELRRHYRRVIIPDFLGLGFSAKPRDHKYSLFEQTDIVEALLDYLKVKDIHVLAHDYGDTVALEVIARSQEGGHSGYRFKVHSVCLSNGGLFPETTHARLGQKLLVLPYVGHIAARLMNYVIFKRTFGEIFGPQTQPSEQEFADFWAAVRWNDGQLVTPLVLQYMEERATYRSRWVGGLQTTDIPVHMIYGPADPVNPPPFALRYKELLPRHGITVLPSHIGHYPMFEAPTEFLGHYFAFKNKLK